MSALPRIALLLLPLLLLSCTDAGVYALDGRAAAQADRADFSGTTCVPLAAGDAFPVKVLFAIQGGDGVPAETVGFATDALSTLSSRFSGPYIQFGLVSYHTVATGLVGRFTDAATFQAALPRYASYQESGPVSLRAPLRLAKSILSGDMQTTCRGEVARTRYVVILIVTSADLSCQNPSFNVGIDSRCRALVDNVGTCTRQTCPLCPASGPCPAAACTQCAYSACGRCELAAVTNEIKALAEQYGAGEVVVQPVYVQNALDNLAHAQVLAIANAGGTELLMTDPQGLRVALGSLNYASLQSSLRLKRFLAFNRNVVVRNGESFADSDGDGMSDKDEEAAGTGPADLDSDEDGLMDGIEVRMGLNPLQVDVIPGCNASLDTDGDRLNTCEERVLGTDPCVGDSDGDGLPDLVEALTLTNPLVPEDLLDSDRDGVINITEIESHGDPHSADLAFHAERGYGYSLTEAEPTPDGRACYAVRVENITLVPTLETAHPFYPDVRIPAGTNDIYLYMQVGKANDPHGFGIGALRIESLRYTEEEGRQPSGTLTFNPDDFVLGT
jgi:hypothetical protein